MDPGDVAGRQGSSRVRVRYAETDQMGVVYHANYLVWFEVGRTDLLRQLGWTYRELELAGVQLPVIEVECRYHRPARYDDEIEIRTTEFDYEAVRLQDDVVTASGRTLHAAVTPDGRPTRLPERVKELFR